MYEHVQRSPPPTRRGFVHHSKLKTKKDLERIAAQPPPKEKKKRRHNRPANLMTFSRKKPTAVESTTIAYDALLQEIQKSHEETLTSEASRLHKLGVNSEEYAHYVADFLELWLEQNPLQIKKDDDYYNFYDKFVFDAMYKFSEASVDMFDQLSDVITRAIGIHDAALTVALCCNLASIVAAFRLFTQVKGKLDVAVAIGSIVSNVLSMACVFISSRVLTRTVTEALRDGLGRVKTMFIEMQSGIVDFVRQLYDNPKETQLSVLEHQAVIERVTHATTIQESIDGLVTDLGKSLPDRINACKDYVQALKPLCTEKDGDAYSLKGWSPTKKAYYGDHWFLPWEVDKNSPNMKINFDNTYTVIPIPKEGVHSDSIRCYLALLCEVPLQEIYIYKSENGGFPKTDRVISDEIVTASEIDAVKFLNIRAAVNDKAKDSVEVNRKQQQVMLQASKDRLTKLFNVLKSNNQSLEPLKNLMYDLGLEEETMKQFIDSQVEDALEMNLVGDGDDTSVTIPIEKFIVDFMISSNTADFIDSLRDGIQQCNSFGSAKECADIACKAGLSLDVVIKLFKVSLDACNDQTYNTVADNFQCCTVTDLEGFICALIDYYKAQNILLTTPNGTYGYLEKQPSEPVRIISVSTQGTVDVLNPAPKAWKDYKIKPFPDTKNDILSIFPKDNHFCADCFLHPRKDKIEPQDLISVGALAMADAVRILEIDPALCPDSIDITFRWAGYGVVQPDANGKVFEPACRRKSVVLLNGEIFVFPEFVRRKDREGYYLTKEVFGSPVIKKDHFVKTNTLGGLQGLWNDEAGNVSYPIVMSRILPQLLMNQEKKQEWQGQVIPTKFTAGGRSYDVIFHDDKTDHDAQNNGKLYNNHFWGCSKCAWQGGVKPVARVKDNESNDNLTKSMSVVKLVACTLCVVMSIVLTHNDAKARPIDYFKNILCGVALGGAAMSGFELFGHLFHKATEPQDEEEIALELRKNLLAYNGIPVETMARAPSVLRASIKKADEVVRFLATHKQKTGINVSLNHLLQRLTEKHISILQSGAYEALRPSTYIMLITSAPGLGKNHAFTERHGFGSSHVGCGIRKLKDICGQTARTKWLKLDANGYFNEMNGEQITIYDEWAMRTEEPMMYMINQVGNNTPATFSGASVEAKHQLFMSDFLILLSNKETLPQNPRINNEAMAAIDSRINHYRVSDAATETWLATHNRHELRPSTLPTDISAMKWEKRIGNNWVATTWNEMWYEAAVHYYNQRQQINPLSIQRTQQHLLGGYEEDHVAHPRQLAELWNMVKIPDIPLAKEAGKFTWSLASKDYDIWEKVREGTKAPGRDDNLYVHLHGHSGKGKTTWMKEVIDDWSTLTKSESACFYISCEEEYHNFMKYQRHTVRAGDIIVTDDVFWEPYCNVNDMVGSLRGIVVCHLSNSCGKYFKTKSPGWLSLNSLRFIWNNLRTVWKTTQQEGVTRPARYFHSTLRNIREGELRRSGLYGNLFVLQDRVRTAVPGDNNWLEVSPDPFYTFEMELTTENKWYVPTEQQFYSPGSIKERFLQKVLDWRNSSTPTTIVNTSQPVPNDFEVEIVAKNLEELKKLLKEPDDMLKELCTEKGKGCIWVNERLFYKFAKIPSLRGSAWQLPSTLKEEDLDKVVLNMFQTFKRMAPDSKVFVKIGDVKYWNRDKVIFSTKGGIRYKLHTIIDLEKEPGKVRIDLIETEKQLEVKSIFCNKMMLIRVLEDGIYGVEDNIKMKIGDIKLLMTVKDQIFDHVNMIGAVTEWRQICLRNKEQARKVSKLQKLKEWIEGDTTTALCFKIFMTLCLLEITIIGVRSFFNWYSGDPVISCIFCKGSYSITKENAKYVTNDRFEYCLLCNKWRLRTQPPTYNECVAFQMFEEGRDYRVIDPCNYPSVRYMEALRDPFPPEIHQNLHGYEHQLKEMQSDVNDLHSRGQAKKLLDQHRGGGYAQARQYIERGAHLRPPEWSANLFSHESGPPQGTNSSTAGFGYSDPYQFPPQDPVQKAVRDFAKGAKFDLDSHVNKLIGRELQSGSGKFVDISHLQKKVEDAVVTLSGGCELQGLRIKGKYVLFPFHLVTHANIQNLAITTKVNGKTYQVTDVHRIGDCDAAIGVINGKDVEFAEDITHIFFPESELNNVKSVGMFVCKKENGTVNRVPETLHSWHTNDQKGFPLEIQIPVVGGKVQTTRGDCGSPYYAIVEEAHHEYLRFVAIHAAKVSERAYEGAVITHERIRETLDAMEGLETAVSNMLKPTVVDLGNKKYNTVVYVKNEIESLASNRKPTFRYKSPLEFLMKIEHFEYPQDKSKRAPWFDELAAEFDCPVLEVDESAPVLPPQVLAVLPRNNHGKPDKIQNQINQILENPKHLNLSRDEYDEMNAVFKDQVYLIRRSYLYQWDVQSPVASMNAVKHQTFTSKPIAVNKSAGFYGHLRKLPMKNQLIDVGPTGNRRFVKGNEGVLLLNYVRRCADLVRRGDSFLTVFHYMAKREALPADKALAGKVRMFSAASVELTIVERMFFMPLIALISAVDGPFRTGYDELVSLGRKHASLVEGFPNVASFDFSRFDKWATKAEVYFAVRLLCWMNLLWCEGDGLMADTIAAAFTKIYCDSPILCKGDLFRANGTLPSGILLTNVIGSAIVHMRTLRAYKYLYEMRLGLKDQYMFHIYPLACGDDLTVYCTDEGLVPLDQLVEKMQENGCKLTTTSKEAVATDIIEWAPSSEGTSFISRTVWWNDEQRCYFSPLKISSIVKCLWYAHSLAYESPADLLLMVITEARAIRRSLDYNVVMKMVNIIGRHPLLKNHQQLSKLCVKHVTAHRLHALYIKTGQNPMSRELELPSPAAGKTELIPSDEPYVGTKFTINPEGGYKFEYKMLQYNTSVKRKVQEWCQKNPGKVTINQEPTKRTVVLADGTTRYIWLYNYVWKVQGTSLPRHTFKDLEQDCWNELWNDIRKWYKVVEKKDAFDQMLDDSDEKGFDLVHHRDNDPVVGIKQGRIWTIFVKLEDGWHTSTVTGKYNSKDMYDQAHTWRRANPSPANHHYSILREGDILMSHDIDTLREWYDWHNVVQYDHEMERGDSMPPQTTGPDVGQPAIPAGSSCPPLEAFILKPKGHGQVHIDVSQQTDFLTELAAMQTAVYIGTQSIPGNVANGDVLFTCGGDDIMKHEWFAQKYVTHSKFGGHYYVILKIAGASNLCGTVSFTAKNTKDSALEKYQNQSIINIQDMLAQGIAGSTIVLQCNLSNNSVEKGLTKLMWVAKDATATKFEVTPTQWEMKAVSGWGSAFISELTASTAMTVSTFVALGHIDPVKGYELTMELGGWSPAAIEVVTGGGDKGSIVGKTIGELDPNSSVYVWSTKTTPTNRFDSIADMAAKGQYNPDSQFNDALRGKWVTGVTPRTSWWRSALLHDGSGQYFTVVRAIYPYNHPCVMAGRQPDKEYDASLLAPVAVYGSYYCPKTYLRFPYIKDTVRLTSPTDFGQLTDYLAKDAPEMIFSYMRGKMVASVKKAKVEEKNITDEITRVNVDIMRSFKWGPFNQAKNMDCWSWSLEGSSLVDKSMATVLPNVDSVAGTVVDEASPDRTASQLAESTTHRDTRVGSKQAGSTLSGTAEVMLDTSDVLVVEEIFLLDIIDAGAFDMKAVSIGSSFPVVVTDGVVNAKMSAVASTNFMQKVEEQLQDNYNYRLTLKHPVLANKIFEVYLHAHLTGGHTWLTQATNEYMMATNFDQWIIAEIKEVRGTEVFVLTDTSNWTSFKLANIEKVKERVRTIRYIQRAPITAPVSNPRNQGRKVQGVRTLQSGDNEYMAFIYHAASSQVKNSINLVSMCMWQDHKELCKNVEWKKRHTLHMTLALLKSNTVSAGVLRKDLDDHFDFDDQSSFALKMKNGAPVVSWLGRTLVAEIDESFPMEEKFKKITKELAEKCTISKPIATLPAKPHVSIAFLRDAPQEVRDKIAAQYVTEWKRLNEDGGMKHISHCCWYEVKSIWTKEERAAQKQVSKRTYKNVETQTPITDKQKAAAAREKIFSQKNNIVEPKEQQAEIAALLGGSALQGLGQGLGAWAASAMHFRQAKWMANFQAQTSKELLFQKFRQASALQNQLFDQKLSLATMRGAERVATNPTRPPLEGPKTASIGTQPMSHASTQVQAATLLHRDFNTEPTTADNGSHIIVPFTRAIQIGSYKTGNDVGLDTDALIQSRLPRAVGTNVNLLDLSPPTKHTQTDDISNNKLLNPSFAPKTVESASGPESVLPATSENSNQTTPEPHPSTSGASTSAVHPAETQASGEVSKGSNTGSQSTESTSWAEEVERNPEPPAPSMKTASSQASKPTYASVAGAPRVKRQAPPPPVHTESEPAPSSQHGGPPANHSIF
ncbi:MAG: polyprotein [Macrobrachium rosenbergii virus 1]|nr:MAG: polyprotein [Macrobrachium rosenbergii virus 1]